MLLWRGKIWKLHNRHIYDDGPHRQSVLLHMRILSLLSLPFNLWPGSMSSKWGNKLSIERYSWLLRLFWSRQLPLNEYMNKLELVGLKRTQLYTEPSPQGTKQTQNKFLRTPFLHTMIAEGRGELVIRHAEELNVFFWHSREHVTG